MEHEKIRSAQAVIICRKDEDGSGLIHTVRVLARGADGEIGSAVTVEIPRRNVIAEALEIIGVSNTRHRLGPPIVPAGRRSRTASVENVDPARVREGRRTLEIFCGHSDGQIAHPIDT